MRRPYVNRPGLPEFRALMREIGAEEPESEWTDEQIRRMITDIAAHERADYWMAEANRYIRRYRNFRACALLMIAALVTLAVVGWWR